MGLVLDAVIPHVGSGRNDAEQLPPVLAAVNNRLLRGLFVKQLRTSPRRRQHSGRST